MLGGERKMKEIIEDYIWRNTEFLQDFLNGWKKYPYYANRGFMEDHHSDFIHGTILGRVRLPISEGLYDMWFPDHCPGKTVFYAVMFRVAVPYSTENGWGETYRWVPTIAISCTHFEYGLPYFDADVSGLMTLVKVVSGEAFQPIYYGEGYVEIIDAYAEKLLMFIKPYSQDYVVENKTFGKALRMFKPEVRDQLLSREEPVMPPYGWWITSKRGDIMRKIRRKKKVSPNQIYVYRVSDYIYGGGVVFVDKEHRKKYAEDTDYVYVGTLDEFIEKVKEEVSKEGEYDESYIE